MQKRIGYGLLLLVLAYSAACAPVSLVASWKDRNAPGKSYRNLMVVGISDKRQMRQVFEEVMATELRKRGVAAIPSYTVTGADELPSRESLEKAVHAAYPDGVLTARVVASKRTTDTRVGYVMTDRGYTNPAFSDTAVMPVDLFGFYGASVVSYATFDPKPVEVTTATTTTVETNLFDAATGRLVWSGTVTAKNPEGIISVTEKFADVVVKELTKGGLLP